MSARASGGIRPKRLGPMDPDLPTILSLIQEAFAPLEGRIDPPSSVRRLTIAGLRSQAMQAEIWSLGTPPTACVILTPEQDALRIGKLAVAATDRRQGHAQHLLAWAAHRAGARGLERLLLQCRIELTENHALFRAAGFQEIRRTAHAGFDRPTSITFARDL